jgi:ribosome biogenesis GTPase
MSLPKYSLSQLGWRHFFAQQVTLEETGTLAPARVTAIHRNALETLTETGELHASLAASISQQSLSASVTVGDWVLVERHTGRAVRVLDRQSTLARLAAGERAQRQLIAANIDSLFIVTSCNDDFNLSRLERYLALARESGVEPVVVLTKADLAASTDRHLDELRSIAPHVNACAVNATSAESVTVLSPWLETGQTVAFVGSSGVGKSTLVNTLTAMGLQSTKGIREDDSKGRHTTTSRQMFALPGGAWVIDTPGMRELKLDVGVDAVSAVFQDIEALAAHCRFRDCAHQGDPGCAVSKAIERGDLDERRLESYRKLLREAARATRTVHERREGERKFGRMTKSALKKKRMDRGEE